MHTNSYVTGVNCFIHVSSCMVFIVQARGQLGFPDLEVGSHVLLIVVV